MGEIKITSCLPSEWRALQAIARGTFVETYESENEEENFKKYVAGAFSDEKIREEFNHPHSYFFLVKNTGKNIGYLKLNELDAQSEDLGNDAMELERIYLKKEFLGKGLGRMMIEKAGEVARVKNKKTLWLGVWVKNKPAIEFYKKMGFTKFGTHTFTVGDDDQNDFLFRKQISTADGASSAVSGNPHENHQ